MQRSSICSPLKVNNFGMTGSSRALQLNVQGSISGEVRRPVTLCALKCPHIWYIAFFMPPCAQNLATCLENITNHTGCSFQNYMNATLSLLGLGLEKEEETVLCHTNRSALSWRPEKENKLNPTSAFRAVFGVIKLAAVRYLASSGPFPRQPSVFTTNLPRS